MEQEVKDASCAFATSVKEWEAEQKRQAVFKAIGAVICE